MPISYENPFDDPLYDPPKHDKDPKIGDPKGPPPDASAGAESFLNPDGTLKEEYLNTVLEQISGSPYFQALAGEQPDLSGYAQTSDLDEAIAGALAGYNLEGPDLSGYAQTGDVQSAISDALGGLGLEDKFSDYMSLQDWEQQAEQFVGQDMIKQMIDDAMARGLSPEEIEQMIMDATGGALTPEQVQQMIGDATQALPGTEQIQEMINQALMDGLSPQEIQDMIAEYLAANPVEGITPETVQQMIDAAIQGMTAGEEDLTQDAVQQMIDAAMAGGMTMDQVQQMLGDTGYMTQEQIQQMMGESGYLGQEGVNASVQAALDAALGEGGAINSAIAAAMQGAGGRVSPEDSTPPVDTTMNFTQPYTPGSFPTNPYGAVNPYSMLGGNQFAGTTPFGGGGAATTGASTPQGIAGLNLGDASQYNFDIPTTPGADLYPTGTNISWDDFLNYGRSASPEDKMSWAAWKQANAQ
jgi:DNA-binding transcriptional regulator YhcF (GntR family)